MATEKGSHGDMGKWIGEMETGKDSNGDMGNRDGDMGTGKGSNGNMRNRYGDRGTGNAEGATNGFRSCPQRQQCLVILCCIIQRSTCVALSSPISSGV